MKNESKSNLIAIFGSLGATGIFFAIVLIMGENSVAITIGLAKKINNRLYLLLLRLRRLRGMVERFQI